MYTYKEIGNMLRQPLEEKIRISLEIIKKFYDELNGNVDVSFSGGKDSTVLLSLVRTLYPKTVGIFANTRIEFPETLHFVANTPNIISLRAETRPWYVYRHIGYPIWSKKVSKRMEVIQKLPKSKQLEKANSRNKQGEIYLDKKHQYLLEAPFKISNKCCFYLKEQQLIKWQEEHKSGTYIGLRAQESHTRKILLAKYGFQTSMDHHPKCYPIIFWREKDIYEYIIKYHLEINPLYDAGFNRQGCAGCLMGSDTEELVKHIRYMRRYHLKYWNYIKNMLAFKKVLKFLDVYL